MNGKTQLSFRVILFVLIITLAGCIPFALPTQPTQALETPKTIPTAGHEVLVKINTINNQSSFSKSEDVILHVTFTNNGQQTIKLLKWFTPLEDFKIPLFTVFRKGELVTYTGKLVKHGSPTGEDYIPIDDDESIDCNANLLENYDLSIAGNYTATYNVGSPQLFENQGGALPFTMNSLLSSTINFPLKD